MITWTDKNIFGVNQVYGEGERGRFDAVLLVRVIDPVDSYWQAIAYTDGETVKVEKSYQLADTHLNVIKDWADEYGYELDYPMSHLTGK